MKTIKNRIDNLPHFEIMGFTLAGIYSISESTPNILKTVDRSKWGEGEYMIVTGRDLGEGIPDHKQLWIKSNP